MDRPYGARSCWVFRLGHGGVASADQVAVPAQDGVGAYREAEFVHGLLWYSVQERGARCPASRSEPRSVGTELPW